MNRIFTGLIISLFAALVGWGFYLYEHNNLALIEQQNVTMDADIRSLSRELSELKLELGQTEKNNKSITVNLDKAQGKVISLEGNVNDLQKSEALLKQQYSKLEVSTRSEIDKMAAGNNSLLEELQLELGTKKKLATEVDVLQQTSNGLNKQIKRLNQKYTGLKQKFDQEELTRKILMKELAQKQGLLNNFHNEMDVLVKNREQLKKDLKDNAITSSKVSELEQKLQVADSEILRHSSQLDDAEKQVSRQVSELKVINQKSDLLHQQVLALQQQALRFEAEKSNAMTEIETLKSELKQVNHERAIEVTNLRNSVTLISIGSDIAYRSSSTTLSRGGMKILDQVASVMKRYPDRIVSLEGHSDSVPISNNNKERVSSNWELSAIRALKSLRYLQLKGIEPERLRIVAYGEHQPIATNDTKEGRRSNRRLEILLKPRNDLITSTQL